MTDVQEQPGTALTTTPKPGSVAKARLQADGAGVMAIVPRDLEEAMRYAKGLAASGIVPDSFRFDGKKANDVNVNLVAMGVLKCLEIGMPPQTGLAFLLPINGRFSVWGDGAWALIQRGGHLASHKVEWHWPEGFNKYATPLDKWPDEIGCTVSMWRNGQADPYINEYTVGRARRAGLWNNSYKKPWITDPERMLFNRARAYCQRDGFSDDLFGLSIVEEVQDYLPPPKQLVADNSALDDDLPALPAPAEIGDLDAQLESYVAGLTLVSSLADLMDYQALPNNQALAGELQRKDDQAYNRMIAANAKRYAEIEEGDRAAEIRDAEAKADAERGSGDLLGDAE